MNPPKKSQLHGHFSMQEPKQNRQQTPKQTVSRSKNNLPSSVTKRPAAPAAYHPQPMPKCLQTKTVNGWQQPPSSQPARSPVAPDVYRPPQNKIAQRKVGDTAQRPLATPLNRTPNAPPVYRAQPVPKVLQQKTAATPPPPVGHSRHVPASPPVYHPQPTPRVLQAKKANAGAAALSRPDSNIQAARPVYKPFAPPRVLPKPAPGNHSELLRRPFSSRVLQRSMEKSSSSNTNSTATCSTSSNTLVLKEDTKLLKNVMQTPSGEALVSDIFKRLKPLMEENLGRSWTLRIGLAPTVGRSVPLQGTIIIDSRLSEADQTQQLVQELWNMMMTPVFGRVKTEASKESQANLTEFVEWHGIPTVMAVWKEAVALKLAWTEGGSPRWTEQPDFEEHLKKVDSSVYKK